MKALVKMAEKMKGGLADNKRPGNFDPQQLRMGIKVEMEHTNNKEVAKEIAMDHLAEDPSYYTKLQKMEKSASRWKGFKSKAIDFGVDKVVAPIERKRTEATIEGVRDYLKYKYDAHLVEPGSAVPKPNRFSIPSKFGKGALIVGGGALIGAAGYKALSGRKKDGDEEHTL